MIIRTSHSSMYDSAKTITIFDSLKRGIEKHGDTIIVSERNKIGDNVSTQKPDAYYQVNMLKQKHFSEHLQSNDHYLIWKSQLPFLVGETASFRSTKEPHNYKRLGWYSYQWGEGVFGAKNCDRDRWNKFVNNTKVEFKDWRDTGDNIVILLQKPGDSSLNALESSNDVVVKRAYMEWVANTIINIRKYTDRPIVIRPHPKFKSRYKYVWDILYNILVNKLELIEFKDSSIMKYLPRHKEYHRKYFQKSLGKDSSRIGKETQSYDVNIIGFRVKGVTVSNQSLEKDLENAHCVVTYNSLSSVEAAQAGVPIICLNDGCMTYPIAHHNLENIENLRYDIDITQWQNDIAYTQWNEEENASGESWEHLKPLIKTKRPELCSDLVVKKIKELYVGAI